MLEATPHLSTKSGKTDTLVNKLNALLANYHVFYQKLRNFHWNVKGDDFFDQHEKFEQYYDTTKLNIDVIAERIRVWPQTDEQSDRYWQKDHWMLQSF